MGKIKTLHDKSKNVKGIKFSRNFGHRPRLMLVLKIVKPKYNCDGLRLSGQSKIYNGSS